MKQRTEAIVNTGERMWDIGQIGGCGCEGGLVDKGGCAWAVAFRWRSRSDRRLLSDTLPSFGAHLC
jgi:hypothetical protein